MGLIGRIFSPWAVGNKIDKYENVHIQLLREMMEVTKEQARTTARLSEALSRFQDMYTVTPEMEVVHELPPEEPFEWRMPVEAKEDVSTSS